MKLDKQHFDDLLALSPQVSITFTRQTIHRLQTEHQRLPVVAAPVTVGLLPITNGIALDGFARRLAQQLERFDEIVTQGHDHAIEVLGELNHAQRSALGIRRDVLLRAGVLAVVVGVISIRPPERHAAEIQTLGSALTRPGNRRETLRGPKRLAPKHLATY